MPHTIKSPTPSSPNPQNGASNPYGYNPNTYSIGSGINSLGGGYATTPAPGYGSITVNGTGAIGAATLTLAPARQVMSMQWIGDELKTVLTGEENGAYVSMELSPERDITSYEQLRITTLLTSIASGGLPSCATLMAYVRRYHLERHFKFSAAAAAY